ncbi:MAG: flavoprotein [Elusimicrobiota bacterium]
MPKARVLLGISASIAAVKTPELVRLFVDHNFEVKCFLTQEATRFVSPLVLSTFSKSAVLSDMFGPDAYQMPHLTCVESSDLLLIAPASAVMLGRCAQGLPEDLVSLAYISTTTPVFMAPAMHNTMWEHPATQANVKVLKDRGVQFLGPYAGPLADKTHGEGRMSEPQEIVEAIEKFLKK